MDSSEVLVRRAVQGDASAFTALIRQHDRELRGYAYTLLGDSAQMDDALQNAYVSAYRAIGRFRGDASFRTWIHRIVHNACIDVMRRRRPTTGLFEDTAVSPDAHDSALTRLAIRAALESLSTDHRALVVMVDVEGMSYDEAASVLGIPVGTVRSRLSRARNALRLELEEDMR